MQSQREPLASVDVAWLRMEQPTNLMTITGVLTFDAPIPVDALRELISERLLIFRRFRQRLVDPAGTPAWEDDPTFDLERHVHRAGLPGPADQGELQSFVSDLMSTPLDFTKPPWQMHLVDGYEGGCALVVRLHHCIADGMALMRVLLSLSDEWFDPSRVPPQDGAAGRTAGLPAFLRPAVRAARAAAATAAGAVRGTVDMAQRPQRLLDAVKQGMSLGAATSKIALMRPDSDTLFRGGVGATKRAAWSRPLALDDVKAVAADAGAKVNDVLMAAVAGGLRRYLKAHGRPVDGVDVRVVVPVNLRPEEEALRLGNHFGLVFLSLPVGLAEPEDRMAAVKARMDRIKYSSEAVVAYGILQAIGTGPAALHRQVVKLLSAKSSAVLTNVAGPQERLHVAGRPLRHLFFWVPRGGTVGLGISIQSYAGKVLLGVAADVQRVPDPDTLVEGIHASFDELRARVEA